MTNILLVIIVSVFSIASAGLITQATLDYYKRKKMDNE